MGRSKLSLLPIGSISFKQKKEIAMPVRTEKVQRIGEYITLQEAARIHGTNTNAIYQWLEYNDVETIQVGRTLLVHQRYLKGYRPHAKGR